MSEIVTSLKPKVVVEDVYGDYDVELFRVVRIDYVTGMFNRVRQRRTVLARIKKVLGVQREDAVNLAKKIDEAR